MYKTGDKFIIEISDEYDLSVETMQDITDDNLTAPQTLYRIKGFNSLVFDENGLDKLEKYEDTYQRGLNDAWNVAKRIVCEVERGGLKDDELQLIFNTRYTDSVLEDYSPSVAIEKIKMYEEQEEQKKNVVIIVGDEVKDIDTDRTGVAIIVGRLCFYMNSEGKIYSNDIVRIKVGRHFPQIAEVLKQMQEGEE